jgi:hypothetical protein
LSGCANQQRIYLYCEFANLPGFTVHRKIHSHELQRWEERGGQGGGGRRGWREAEIFLGICMLKKESDINKLKLVDPYRQVRF